MNLQALPSSQNLLLTKFPLYVTVIRTECGNLSLAKRFQALLIAVYVPIMDYSFENDQEPVHESLHARRYCLYVQRESVVFVVVVTVDVVIVVVVVVTAASAVAVVVVVVQQISLNRRMRHLARPKLCISLHITNKRVYKPSRYPLDLPHLI
jgi:hypothetical protein